jgi:hypothetical protein
MCIYTHALEPCTHSECLFFNNSIALFSLFNSVVHDQSILISQLLVQQSLINQKLNNIANTLNKGQLIQNFELLDDFSLDNRLYANTDYPLRIILGSKLPDIIYKEKRFELTTSVIDRNERKVVLQKGEKFKIAVFSMENPPKQIKLNVSGNKALRGSVESSPNEDGSVIFPKVVINEVSSHYLNDSFSLVVICTTLGTVKPLILPNISVKARKHVSSKN